MTKRAVETAFERLFGVRLPASADAVLGVAGNGALSRERLQEAYRLRKQQLQDAGLSEEEEKACLDLLKRAREAYSKHTPSHGALSPSVRFLVASGLWRRPGYRQIALRWFTPVVVQRRSTTTRRVQSASVETVPDLAAGQNAQGVAQRKALGWASAVLLSCSLAIIVLLATLATPQAGEDAALKNAPVAAIPDLERASTDMLREVRADVRASSPQESEELRVPSTARGVLRALRALQTPDSSSVMLLIQEAGRRWPELSPGEQRALSAALLDAMDFNPEPAERWFQEALVERAPASSVASRVLAFEIAGRVAGRESASTGLRNAATEARRVYLADADPDVRSRDARKLAFAIEAMALSVSRPEAMLEWASLIDAEQTPQGDRGALVARALSALIGSSSQRSLSASDVESMSALMRLVDWTEHETVWDVLLEELESRERISPVAVLVANDAIERLGLRGRPLEYGASRADRVQVASRLRLEWGRGVQDFDRSAASRLPDISSFEMELRALYSGSGDVPSQIRRAALLANASESLQEDRAAYRALLDREFGIEPEAAGPRPDLDEASAWLRAFMAAKRDASVRSRLLEDVNNEVLCVPDVTVTVVHAAVLGRPESVREAAVRLLPRAGNFSSAWRYLLELPEELVEGGRGAEVLAWMNGSSTGALSGMAYEQRLSMIIRRALDLELGGALGESSLSDCLDAIERSHGLQTMSPLRSSPARASLFDLREPLGRGHTTLQSLVLRQIDSVLVLDENLRLAGVSSVGLEQMLGRYYADLLAAEHVGDQIFAGEVARHDLLRVQYGSGLSGRGGGR